MKRIINKITVLFLLGVFAYTNLFAGETGKISGYITDKATGEPLIGANVLVEGTFLGAAADENGYYYILNVPPGKHVLKVSFIGFNDTKVKDVIVNVDKTTKIDVQLTDQSIELGQEIIVTAERPLVTKDLTSSSSTVSSDEINMMPVEELGQVVGLQAGVVDGHFRGGRSGEVAYLVDGVQVNDAYDGGVSVQIENNAVRQLEVISGTFNAEYGNAMSGIVNIVTKDAGIKYDGSATFIGGKYFSLNNNIYQNLDTYDSGLSADAQFTLSGPTKLIPNLGFFLSGRYVKSDGAYYGRRIYNMTDTDPFAPTGDSAYVPMSTRQRYSINGKLTYQVKSWKLTWNTIFDKNKNNYYDHGFSWAPDGVMDHFRDNLLNSFQLSFVPNQSSFGSLRLAHNRNEYYGYLFEDEYDSRYINPLTGIPTSQYTFRQGGQQQNRYERHTYTTIGSLTFETQVSKEHKLKMGVEGNYFEVYNHSKNIVNLSEGELDDNGNEIFTLGYRELGTPGNQEYLERPFSMAAYLQDKMEYDIMIINLGVRFDYFNANTNIPVDMRNPSQVAGNPDFPGYLQLRKVDAKYQVSPRLGLSFPISDKGAIHFSYGHFFQMPTMQYLYLNKEYIIEQSNLSSVTGNPDLRAQKTVKYEIGLQQVIFPNVAVDVSAYYSDIRDLLSTEILNTYEGFKYARFTNKDYANVTGVILSLDKRFADYFSVKADYTLQIAEGNSSDPMSVFNDNQSNPPVESEKTVVPLNWDQRHTLNLTANAGVPGDWMVGFIASYGSGLPYTEDIQVSNGVRFENGGRKPSTLTFDMSVDKYFNLFGLDWNARLLVYNLFDIKNEYGVYSTTGRATTDLNVKYAGDVNGLNTIDQYITNPGMYSSPREIKLSVGLRF